MHNKLFISMLVIGTATVLTSCNKMSAPNWADDCDKYSSVDSREYSQCIARRDARVTDSAVYRTEKSAATNGCCDQHPSAGTVRIDSSELNRTAAQDIGKGH